MTRLQRCSMVVLVFVAACHEASSGPEGPARLGNRGPIHADSAPGSDTLAPPPDSMPPDSVPPDTTTPPVDSSRVARVLITPNNARVAAGDSVGFFANLYARDGRPLSGRPVTWVVADRRIARIEGAFGQSVVIRALRPGMTRVIATSQGRRDAAILVVRRR